MTWPLAIVAMVAIGALGATVFIAWILSCRLRDLTELFMAREASIRARVKAAATEAVLADKKPDSSKPKVPGEAMLVGFSGNRRSPK